MAIPFENKYNKNEWNKEAEICLNYALEKIQKEIDSNIKINKLAKTKVLNDYYKNCAIFSGSYIKGNLDSFQKAACLMTAIQHNILFYADNQLLDIGRLIALEKTVDEMNSLNCSGLKALLALYSALKMCENPVCYVGENCDELRQLEAFNLKQFKTEYKSEWEALKYELFIYAYYSEGKYSETLYEYLMLKYLYQYVNLKLKISNNNLSHADLVSTLMPNCDKDPLTEIPEPQMKLYGFSGAFASAYFETEEEKEKYIQEGLNKELPGDKNKTNVKRKK